MGRCELGECPHSKTLKNVCCLDCNELKLCLEKNYTCLYTLRSKISENCDYYIPNKI
jgi:hypothetical protein